MTATMQDPKFGDRIFLPPRVPQGLAAAVEGLTREVIRHQPDNIYVFAAHHFEKLLHLREQYDDDTSNNKSMKVLNEINDALKERQSDAKSNERTGWSLNETAKVLEKHRSIFGESGQKMSTEQVRELANETKKFNGSNSSEVDEKLRDENKDCRGKCPTLHSSRRKESPRVSSQQTATGKNNLRHTPRIISQIPIAKDIKTELKRNRMSSKERRKFDDKRMQLACEYSEETIIEKSSKKTIEKTRKSHEVRSEHRKNSRVEESTKKKIETTRNRTESWEDKKFSRSMSMDRVKNYVVQNFVGMTSLEDLQTPSYVEKVQEVIDETSTVIKEKVEALKTGVVKASKNQKEQKKQHSSSSEDSSKSRKKSAEKKDRTARETLQESVSPLNLSKELDSQAFQTNGESSRSLDNRENSIDQSECLNSDASEKSKMSLPAMRPTSSKSTSRSQSARSDSDGLVLPPISPESAKSTKVKEDLVLPVLSPPQSNPISPDVSVASNHSNGKDVQKQAPLANDEEFKDSLNVTPRSSGSPQRPDSLESPRTADQQNAHNSPLETLKDKLLEIEEVQKRIEGVLDDTVTGENSSSDKSTAGGIQDKLLEIEESERRIERILDSQSVTGSNSETMNSDIKNKLQELEEVEKRIESIFVNEIKKEAEETVTSVTQVDQDAESSDHTETNRARRNAESDEKNNLEIDADNAEKKEKIDLPAENSRAVSPHSYILTEGSPYDIPDSVTTVIIPDRNPTPDSETLQLELQDEEIYTTLMSHENVESVDNSEQSEQEKSSSIHDAFGEPVEVSTVETSTVDITLIESIKISHDILVTRQDLDLIHEEREKEAAETEAIDSEDEKVLKVVTSSLEEILENDKVEYVSKEEVQKIANSVITEETNDSSPGDRQNAEYESTDETKETSITDGIAENETEINENSLEVEETTARSAESTNEIKETSITTDKSSLSLDPAIPIVPELNLDSLPDLTISSFNITDDEQNEDKVPKESKDSTSLENLVDSSSVKEDVSTEGDTPLEPDPLKDETSIDVEGSDRVAREISSEIQETTTEVQKETIENLETSEDKVPEDNAMVANNTELQEVVETESVTNNENISSQSGDENNDAPAEINVYSNVDVVNINKIADAAPDDINNSVCNESDKKEEEDEAQLENQNNTFDNNQHDDAEQLVKEINNESICIIESSQLINEDHENKQQTNELSRISSQCTSTRQLESDELSIETNVGDDDISALKIDESQAIDDVIQKDERTVTENLTITKVDEIINDEKVENLVDETVDDKKQCHIYLPESSTSKDLGSSTESSTFLSAATKIQAGVRGFLTRRRLQSTQRRSSTLDSVPSIQESFAAEGGVPGDTRQTTSSTSHLMPTISEAKARKKLRREDAVQRTTLSVENAFAENQLQHTGEFHDCIPLPVFDARTLDLRIAGHQKQQQKNKEPSGVKDTPNVEELLGNLLLGHAAHATNFSGPTKLGQFVDVVLLPGDTELQSRYLNFITSVEDVANELFDPLVLPDTPKGVIIEEITSLDETPKEIEKISECPSDDTTSQKDTKSISESDHTESAEVKESTNSNADSSNAKIKLEEPTNDAPELEEISSLVEASIATSEEPLSMNIDEVLGLGEEDERKPRDRLTVGKFIVNSSSASQESHLSDERTKSPVTMMQIAPSTSVEEKSEEKIIKEDVASNGSITVEQAKDLAEEKEQQSHNELSDVNAGTNVDATST